MNKELLYMVDELDDNITEVLNNKSDREGYSNATLESDITNKLNELRQLLKQI
ncbi:hypothetical protein [Clostridium botulinum]|uniref:hypothetical protein n=1 Tax=Clostridium botulinum TaxID=1491 RepID=UPI0019679F89|nr:hypothetical protein [Clostridium botulinum]